MSQSTSESSYAKRSSVETTCEVLVGVVRALVQVADQVTVKTLVEGGTTVVVLSVAPDDLGKLLGMDGRTARSLRAIVRAIGSTSNHSMELEIQARDPNGASC